MNAGDTFFLPGEDHLWMIISDPVIDSENVVLVCFVSYRPYYDQSCIVEVGEHPFIRHRTLVDYSSAFITSVQLLSQQIEAGEGTQSQGIRPRQPLSPELLFKIRSHCRGSNMSLECLEILAEQDLIG